MARAGTIAAVWGVAGVVVLIGNAIFRLTPLAIVPIETGMTAWQWTLYVASALFNGYSEGYRAFQLQFAPRVAVRALHLARNPRPLHAVLAPLYCMGLIHATRRRLVISWATLVGVVGIVILVQRVPQPYRGIIDVGVVLGLAWGVTALLVFVARAAAGKPPRTSPDLPAG